MSYPSDDARHIGRAIDALTTQVRRIADAQTTPVAIVTDGVTTPSDDAPTTPATTCSARYTGTDPMRWCIRAAHHTGQDHVDETGFHWSGTVAIYPINNGVVKQHIQSPAPAAGEDAHHIARRRDSILNLLARLERGHLTAEETALLRNHVIDEGIEHDTARSEAAYYQQLSAEQGQALSRADQARAELERDRNQHAAVLAEVLGHFTVKGHPGEPCLGSGWVSVKTVEQWRSVLHHDVERPWWQQVDEAQAELGRANDVVAETKRLMERRTTTLRLRAERAEAELRTLRSGIRALGGDPTTIQNLWAQLRLRNRQWRETKRELRVTRSMLEEEGGDVSLVDEMIDTVNRAEHKAREAQDTIDRIQDAAALHRKQLLSNAELYAVIGPGLDGTEQPTTGCVPGPYDACPNCPHDETDPPTTKEN